MKVTDKKFLNVHQTIGPLTVSTTVTSSAKNEENGGTKSEKLLVSLHFSIGFSLEVSDFQNIALFGWYNAF